MTTIKKLEKMGYRVTKVMGSGNYVATKGNRTYMASTITALYKKIV